MNMNVKQLLKGIISYVPGARRLNRMIVANRRTIGVFSVARYCYSVWLRHLTMAYKNGLSTQPDVIAELGPGNSLGTGLAGLISGAKEYYVLDVAEYANLKRNIEIFDELVNLFRKRENIPDETEFPSMKPYLESYEFPNDILTDERLSDVLKQNRIESIRNALLSWHGENVSKEWLFYLVPWHNLEVIKEESVDMIFTQAVFEHIDKLAYTYERLCRWLKPGGFISHEIDFKSHNIAKKWNGHWTYSDFVWKLMRGKRTYLINRQPHSTHIKFLQKFGFEIVCDVKEIDRSGIQRKDLAPRFKNLSDEDLTTSAAFIQAIKEI